MKTSHMAWAHEEFGRAQLGDARRGRRLVEMAAKAARRPAGTVTGVFATSAHREGAYRLLENEALDREALTASASSAAARRSAMYREVIVPMDGSSLTFSDPADRRGLGPVGTRSQGALGVIVMTALAVAPTGTTLGILDQQYWARSKEPPKKPTRRRGSKHDKRPREQRESFVWVEGMRRAAAVMASEAPGTRPWFQLDRGGDCLSVLIEAADADLQVTVRAVHDRCLCWPDGQQGRLLPSMLFQPVLGTYVVDVPGRPRQVERRATLSVRVARLPLVLRTGRKKRRVLETTVVLAREQGAPQGQEPLQWLLITTHPVESLADAIDVVAAYSMRWRIEDFHKTWKSGACNVESSKLESKEAILRWATIMASVAARIEGIKHAARNIPDRPATDVFSRDEVDAAILLFKSGTKLPIAYKPGDTPTVAEVTRWIASLGGHMGNPKTRPPGATVIRRGLELVEGAAMALASLRAEKM